MSFTAAAPSGGWDAPPSQPWLLAAQQAVSEAYFGKPAMFKGLGGTIPFMAMLASASRAPSSSSPAPEGPARTPTARFLHLPMAERLTACVADVIAVHHRARRG